MEKVNIDNFLRKKDDLPRLAQSTVMGEDMFLAKICQRPSDMVDDIDSRKEHSVLGAGALLGR